MARKADAKRAEIIEFWRTVEMFSPQSVEKVRRERLVFAVQPGEPLPWEPDHEIARRPLRSNQTWRHVVYLGTYRLDAVFETISRFFEPDLDSFDERPAGESAVAMFLVDEDGKAVLDSAVLSSCAWATGQVLSRGRRSRDWLRGFEDAAERFSEAWSEQVIKEIVPPVDEDSPPTVYRWVLDHVRLRACLAAATAPAGVGEALSCTEIRIRSQIVARRTADSGGHEFLNSFIMGDLEWVAGRAAKGDVGAALCEYLRPEAEIRTTARVDVRAQPAAYPTLPPSKWIDVSGATAQGHWIPDEGRQLDRVLGTLADLQFDMSEVMVIAPFRDIARQVSGRSRRYPGLVAGTVHTAQGKQADIVILVLGGNPQRPGARQWAASRPNLLNVAVSRAKRRLYVIGDRRAWAAQRHFSVLAADLPHTTPIKPH
ncbi:AAA domain-containing protein [Phytohabitans suffuscus]|uniref:AAA domain-containing protein n=1 Tax=Phytohabitans suffuscus TaxID=624315 RepID=UPI0015636860|nr:AAA domain-containing protein [Phytohabitans suffuscus]